MSQSPLEIDESITGSSIQIKNLYHNIEAKFLLNQSQQSLHQHSPSSNGSLKASPQFYHSPQINSSKQKASKFNLESGFSPSLRNRIIQQATINRGCNTPSSSFFKQTENTKDSPLFFDSEISNSNRQKTSTRINYSFSNSKSVSVLPLLGQNLDLKGKKEETLQLPYIETQINKSVQNIKNRLSQLEEKPSFFDEVNKLSRKSLASNLNTASDLNKSGQQSISEFSNKSHRNLLVEREQLNQSVQHNQENNNLLRQINLTLSVNKSPKIASTSRPSLFQEGYTTIKSDQRLTPQKIYSPNPNSCINKLCYQSKESIEGDSNKNKGIQIKKPSIIFKYPISEKQNSSNTLLDVESSNNNIQNTTNNNQTNNQTKEQHKDTSEIQSSQTFSSEDDSAQNQTSQNINQKQSQIKNILNINKLQQIDSSDQKNGYYSPQIGSQTLRRRKTDNYMIINQINTKSPANKDELISNFASKQIQKSDKFLNLFQLQHNNSTNNLTFSQIYQSADRASLMRQLYYLLPDIKKFVTDEIEKDEDLKSSIFSFYMMQDINEFTFLFSQFLDHLAEQRLLTDKTFPNKFPKKILSKITSFMLCFLSHQKENSEQLKSLLNEQITKSLCIIMPSTLLEALGGYSKLKSLSQQIFKMFQASALTNQILITSEEVGASKIEEFLLAALQKDLQKTQKMIDELKKYSGTSYSGTEFYVMKLILFNYFNSHSYYSDEVKFSFFELLESVRYQFTEEEGFNQILLEQKNADILKEMLFIWKQDPILSQLKESYKNSSQQFIQSVFDYTFLAKNCYQISSAYHDSFSSQLDILVIKSLHQMAKVATKRQGITQNQIQMNINFLFKKFQWFISKGNLNYISVIGNCKEISDQMFFIILNQKVNNNNNNNNDSPSVTSPVKEGNSFTELDGSNKSTGKSKVNKFRLLHQLQQANQQQNQQKQNLSTQQSLADISNFSQFISLFFNFYSTFHYSDLVNFFKYEKCTMEIFQFWTQIFQEALTDVRGIPAKLASEISKFIFDLFEFLKKQ